MRGSRFIVSIGLALSLACGEAVKAPARDVFTEEFAFTNTANERWLFIVDDRMDAMANELRTQFLQEFVATEEDSSRYCAPSDPAAWFPVRRDAFVVFPSAPTSERLVGPASVQTLALRTNRATDEAMGEWARAVADTIEATPTTPEGAFALLSAMASTVKLLREERAPETSQEELVAESASASDPVLLVLVAARDDESEAAPRDYQLPLGKPLEEIFASDIVLPATDDAACDEERGTTARLGAWVSASEPFFYSTWRPEDTCSLRQPGLQCGSPRCLDGSPRIGLDGAASCNLYVESDSDAPCPSEIGWHEPEASDPDATPRLDPSFRVCQVRQLESEALESCRSELECSECEPGFCFTDVESLQGDCAERGAAALPRLILGAGRGAAGRFQLVCER